MKNRVLVSCIILSTLVFLLLSSAAHATEYRKADTEVKSNEILKHIEKGEDIYLENCSIVGELNLSKIELEKVPNPRYSEFLNHSKDSRIFVITNFGMDDQITGIGSSIAGEVKFPAVNKSLKSIKSNFTIYNSIFENSIDFSNALFIKPLSFEGVQFYSNVTFIGSQFNDCTNFYGSDFKGPSDFTYATFNNISNFSDVTFNNTSDFICTNFNNMSDFRSSFFKNTHFSMTIFNDTVDFDCATFNDLVDFSYVSFKSTANFWNAKFNTAALFSMATFSDSAYFKCATFKDTDFGKATFNGYADFINATFSDATFGSTTFNSAADFKRASFSDMLNLNFKLNNSTADFTNANFKDTTNFYDFKELNENIILNGASCQQLVKCFEYNGKDEDANIIYYNYRRYCQAQKSLFEISKWTDCIVWLICGYGTRPFNALIFGTLIILLFSIIYLNPFCLHKNKSKGVNFSLSWNVSWDKSSNKIIPFILSLKNPGVVKESDQNKKVSLIDLFYYSMGAFTFMNQGSWCPRDNFRKWAVVEGVLGWITLGIFMATLTNVITQI